MNYFNYFTENRHIYTSNIEFIDNKDLRNKSNLIYVYDYKLLLNSSTVLYSIRFSPIIEKLDNLDENNKIKIYENFQINNNNYYNFNEIYPKLLKIFLEGKIINNIYYNSDNLNPIRALSDTYMIQIHL